ncbi:cubilin-like [Amphiura filiformis]|uniref:cubilin-like n=1 Tax=Amphiura filiformis TaxID=82378 RepID=UPI003B22073C
MILFQIVRFLSVIGFCEHALANNDGNLKTFPGHYVQCTGAYCLEKKESISISKRDSDVSNMEIPHNCNRVLTSNSGQVTSPNWPKKQVDFTRCRITISLEHSLRPVLTFDQFELEGTNQPCEENEQENYVLIQDAVTLRQERICGSTLNFTWMADSNEVVLVFVALSSTVFHRFKASYVAVTRHPPTDCSTTLASKVGTYASLTTEELAALNTSLLFLQCKVLFHAPAGNRVLLSFGSVVTRCEMPVMVKDVLTGREAEVCGDLSQFSWLSDGNEVMMNFSQDINNPTAVDVVLEYESIESPDRDCSTTLSLPKDGSTSHISTPLYPNPYPSSLECETFISSDPTMIVVITFDVFQLEPSIRPVEQDMSQVLPMLEMAVDAGLQQEECVYDYVQIQDMTTDRVDRFCGVRHPFSWTSDSNQVHVLFCTDNMLSFTGFTAKLYAMERLPQPDCITMVANSPTAAFLTSTLYPLPYPSNVDCTLLIHQHPDQFVTLDFRFFDLEASEGCQTDMFQITDVTSSRWESFCGTLLPFTWSSDSNEILIKFKTDNEIEAGGFSVIGAATIIPSKALVGSGCRDLFTEPSGEIKLVPLHSEFLPAGGGDCFILIHGSPQQRIRLLVTELIIENENDKHGEELNFLEIQDIAPHGGRNDLYYGTEITPYVWTSERNEISIYLHQNTASLASVRLQASYHMFKRVKSDCSLSYTGPSGNITWTRPSFPADVEPNSIFCDITIHVDASRQVLIIFKELILEGNDCQEDSFKIADHGTGISQEFCSSQSQFSWMSMYNELSIKFYISGSTAPFSVEASYNSMPRPVDKELHKFMHDTEGSFSTLDHIRSGVGHDDNCSVTILANADEIILLRFHDFLVGAEQTDAVSDKPIYIHPNFSCQHEFVELLDITSGRSSTYCGKYSMFSWTSDANLVIVTYAINSAAFFHGFRATYQTIPRLSASSQFLINRLDSLQSENFPSHYPIATEQHWILHAEPDYLLSLRFINFALEESPDCTKDYVELYDLTTADKTKLCGTYGLFVWTSKGNEVMLTLHSDDLVTKSGIYVIYQHILKPSAATCQFQSYDVTGRIEPQDLLEDNQMWFGLCQFALQLLPQYRIRLTINELNTSDNCTNSGLKVIDSGSLRKKDFCNASHSFSWTSDTNRVVLKLMAFQDQIPEFSIRWQGITRTSVPECTEVYDNPIGLWTIDSTNFAALASNPHCQILFTVEPHQRILLSLLDSVFTKTSDCDKNYIQLEDSTSERLDRYCGTEAPFSWAADSNEVLVTLIRSTDFAFTQWLVNFDVIDRPPVTQKCSKILTEPKGMFESVGYPLGYLSNQECHTLVHTHPHNILIIKFTDFRLELAADDGCIHDYVEIMDITTHHVERLCGYQYPFSWTTDSNEVLIKFVSDGYLEEPGFAASYTTIPKLRKATDCNLFLTSDNGTISTPSQDTKEALAQELTLICHYIIHAMADKKVLLQFDALHLAADTQCGLDAIEISDVTTGRSNKYCQSLARFEWMSDSNEVNITFITNDITRDYAHYSISYKFIDAPQRSVCDLTLSDSEGTIQSPGYPASYGNNMNCTITIVAKEGQLISIDITKFDFEYSTNCTYDYVEFQTAHSGDRERYCGQHIPFVWLSTGNIATIFLRSDHLISKQGLRGSYNFIDMVQFTMDCDTSLTTPSGFFESPGYPNLYPNNRDCQYRITAEHGMAVEINFEEFELEYQDECTYDYVKITDETTDKVDIFCGSKDAFKWVSHGNQVLLEFHTDSSAVFRGFKAYYDTKAEQKTTPIAEQQDQSVPECSEYLNDTIGFFSSPKFPLPYPTNEVCHTYIQTKAGTKIQVTFRFLEIEEHFGCTRDSVQVEDRETGRKSPLLCGELENAYSWNSDSNRVVVIFQSDSVVSHSGYYATYKTIK